MSTPRNKNFFLALVPALFLSSAVAVAQGTQTSGGTTAATHSSSLDRLYVNFIEDAMIVDEQRWEGWFQYDDSDFIDVAALYGQAAFQIWRNSEIGGRVGFGKTDSSSGAEDGTGATDFDLWAKYYWNLGDRGTEMSAGAIVTIPTGDDSAGLGMDAFALKGFGAIRYSLNHLVLTGTLGLQTNDNGQTLGSGELDGDISFTAGAGVIIPWSDAFSFIGELSWKSARFEGLDDDARLLGGLNLRLSDRGMLRPAVAAGLDDGAPDFEFIIGYAHSF
jgi:hypothetical protein